MREISRREVNAADVVSCVILIVIDLVAKTESRSQQVGEIRVAIERFRPVAKVVVEPSQQIGLTEWLRKSA
jgi:hypothetical protein